MNYPIQPQLENNDVILIPLVAEDFEELYTAASDPKIWEQHPNKDRWKRAVFQTFFEGAIQSKSAFKIVDKKTKECIGSTRFYDYDQDKQNLFIGYTFYTVSCWGKGINTSVKEMMLDYAFQWVSSVNFHIGSENMRSQIAIKRIGAEKIAEEQVAYFGEPSQLNYVYEISKDAWENRLRKESV